LLGGLAVYRRGLTAPEMAALAGDLVSAQAVVPHPDAPRDT
jgi:hypothetical protein